MKLIRGHVALQRVTQSSAVTIGNFDGVHRGHQALVERVCDMAREHDAVSCVVIFEPQPLEYFRPDKAPVRLYGLRQKLGALKKLGVDSVCVLPFHRELADLPAEQFVEQVLVRGLNTQALLIGDDWRFGHERRGDFALLQSLQEQHGYALERAGTVEDDGSRISSTRIRQLLLDGETEAATRLLGRHYGLCGRVIYGAQLGRKLGAPTANIAFRRELPLAYGVYLCWLNGLPAVANFGVRPSVADNRPSLEVHVLDRELDLYNCRVDVTFGPRLRSERRFESLGALQAQIHRDFDDARRWHSQQR